MDDDPEGLYATYHETELRRLLGTLGHDAHASVKRTVLLQLIGLSPDVRRAHVNIWRTTLGRDDPLWTALESLGLD